MIGLASRAVRQLREVTRAFFRRTRPEMPSRPGAPTGFVFVQKVQTPSGGIAASSSASCTIRVWGGSSYSNGTGSLTVWNPMAGNAITGSTDITVVWANGRWEANMVPC